MTSSPRTPPAQQTRSPWEESVSSWKNGPSDFKLTQEDTIDFTGMLNSDSLW